MKLLSSTTFFIGYLLISKVSSAQHLDAEESSPTAHSSLRAKTNKAYTPGKTPSERTLVSDNNDEATADIIATDTWSIQKTTTKGLVLVKGGLGTTISTSSITSAQDAGMAILQSLPESSGSETFVAANANPMHMRYVQQIHGMTVEGASLYVHVEKDGTVLGVNGEIVDGTSVPAEPTIDAGPAIEAALKESRVPAEEYSNCSPPSLTVVRGLADGEAHLAWTCTVRYDVMGEDGYLKPFNDQIFARATGDTPGLIQIHPKIYGARSLETQNCMQTQTACTIASTSPYKISVPTDVPIEAAHNYAIDVYDYYLEKHGRDSLDDNGMTLISRVHFGYRYNNAFWDGSQMTYGDGDGAVFGPLSLGADVVAHEMTHGVTHYSSGLIYADESGALSDAISDIFSALIESYIGKDDNDIWQMGEDIFTPGTPGDALRYMCDPAKDITSRDYYPERYIGPQDNGGVHWNCGIANLAACLLVKGGPHPRGKTPGVVVPAIIGGYDALGSIFYQANTNCLTPSSNFVIARWCTADVFGGSNKDNVHLAWDAVGVPTDLPPPPPAPTPFTVDSSGTGTFTNQAASTGELHHYTMPIREGSTISCSTMGKYGDADLYIRFGTEVIPNPFSSVNACASAGANSNESCTTLSRAPSGGTMAYVGVHAYRGYSYLIVTCRENLVKQPTKEPTRKPTRKPTKKNTKSAKENK